MAAEDQKGKLTKSSGSFKRTSDQVAIKRLVSEKLLNKELSVESPSFEKKNALIVSIDEDDMVVRFEGFIPPVGSLLLTGFINNYYTELGLNVVEPVSSYSFRCKPTFLRIASVQRNDERFNIRDDLGVYINYIRIAKTELDFKGGKVPVSFKILFQKLSDENADLADKVMIQASDEMDKNSLRYQIIRSGKSIFLPDARDLSLLAEHEENSDILNLKEALGNNLNKEMAKLISEEKIGWIACPISIPEKEDKWIPIAVLELFSKSPFEIYKFMEVKALALKVVEKLRDMNVVEINQKQRIIDVSRGGLGIEIKDPELYKMIHINRYFLFNIMLKMQAPITFRGWLRYSKEQSDGSHHIGIKIQGETERQDHMKRYLHFVKSLAEGKKQEEQRV
jgi:hypothetical protein